MDLEQRWNQAWKDLGTSAPDGLLAEVLKHYGEPQRAYHTLEHLQDCFARFDEAPGLAQQPAEVVLALWFHDAIYEPERTDNEAGSARWALEALLAGGVREIAAQRVRDLILATSHVSASLSGDAALVVDIDLAILGASADRFERYDQQIRQEYAWVPAAEFRLARLQILSRFLDRPAIFSTRPFRERYESQARKNLRLALKQLNLPPVEGN
jgi:predicted metal-dependent HD superfamily phosphohydrolase